MSIIIDRNIMQMEQMNEVQEQLASSLQHFEEYYSEISRMDNGIQYNNHRVIPTLVKVLTSTHTGTHNSYRILQYTLQFMTDTDILSLAASCRVLYRLFYSPLGYRLLVHLRPITIITTDEQAQLPHFSQSTVDQLCSDRKIEDADEDDKMAILLTMRTNILATKQKIRELEEITHVYDTRSEQLLGTLMYIGGTREMHAAKIEAVNDQIEKLREILKATEGHQGSLRDEQQRLMADRNLKMDTLREEQGTRQRQKELLIKKIKSQQKEREEGMIYAREVERILAKLSDMTSPATNNRNSTSDAPNK